MPFTLMFGQSQNPFMDYRNTSDPNLTNAVAKHLTNLKELQSIILPSISKRNHETKETAINNFYAGSNIVDKLLPGTQVMVIDQLRKGKLDPLYEGPFIVVHKDQAGAYTLRDHDGEELHHKMTINMLKVIPNNSPSILELPVIEDDIFVVESIQEHCKDNHGMHYLVKWKDPANEDSWVQEKDFNDLDIVKQYWKQKNLGKKVTKQ